MISEQIEAQILAKDNPDIWCEYSSLRTQGGGLSGTGWLYGVAVQLSDPAIVAVRLDTQHSDTYNANTNTNTNTTTKGKC